MEKTVQQQLQQIKGIGEVLAQRLIEAGIDSFVKLSEAGEEGLRKIRGINPRAIPAIIEQARGLAGEVAVSTDEQLRILQETTQRLEKQVQELALNIRQRQTDKPSGKKEARFEKEMKRLLDGLEQVKKQQRPRIKRVRKSLAKAGKKLTAIKNDGIKNLTRSFKKARKSLRRAWA